MIIMNMKKIPGTEITLIETTNRGLLEKARNIGYGIKGNTITVPNYEGLGELGIMYV